MRNPEARARLEAMQRRTDPELYALQQKARDARAAFVGGAFNEELERGMMEAEQAVSILLFKRATAAAEERYAKKRPVKCTTGPSGGRALP